MNLLTLIVKYCNFTLFNMKPIAAIRSDDYDAMRAVTVEKAGKDFGTWMNSGRKTVRFKVLKAFADITEQKLSLHCAHLR